MHFNPSETFTNVPGRLSLLSSAPKYRVTVGEIQRRISPPENLNASVLGGILRRAKSKDGGKALRDMLKQKGLVLPAGRRKSANVTSLTALVEVEADHLAKDFRDLCEKDFPARAIAEHLTRTHCVNNNAEIQRRKDTIVTTQRMLGELSELLKNDRSPTGADNPPPQITLDHSIQKHLTHFSLVTHGFGSQAVMAAILAINNWLEESAKILEK
jgi:transcription factor AP-2